MNRNGKLMTDDERKECLGRVCLWTDAFRECKAVLTLAIRAAVDEHDRRPPLSPLNPDGSRNAVIPMNSEGQPFPTWEESRQIAASLPMYAAVLFCQFYGNGKAQKGTVAANRGPMNTIRANVISRAFPNQPELEQFKELSRLVTDARNEMIAHAQGDAFKVSHGPGSVTWHPTPALPDLSQWLACVRALELAMYAEHGTLAHAEPSH